MKKGTWNILPIFTLLQRAGNLSESNLYNTFNMGIGMVIALDASKADAAVECLKANGETASIIGEVVAGENGVDIL